MRGELDALFRRSAGAITGALVRTLGPQRLELAEAAVQEAFVRALETWPKDGIPANPGGWVLAVARNHAFDQARRTATARGKTDEVEAFLVAVAATPEEPPAALKGELDDDELRMIFVACHPEIAIESQIALVLRTLLGMDVTAIARALLSDEAAVAKRLVRARQTLRDASVTFDLPDPREIEVRRDAVLAALYLLFSEGYSAHAGERQTRAELCDDAIRLASRLLDHPLTRAPEVHALVALMLFQSSRLAARTDADGALVTLAEQDRGAWDRDRIARGVAHLGASAEGDRISRYHLEAAIASCHARAPRWEETDWATIVETYDALANVDPSPVVLVARAVAVGRARGAAEGLRALRRLDGDPVLTAYFPLYAALGEAYAETGDSARARAAFRRAVGLAGTTPERRWVEKKLAALG